MAAMLALFLLLGFPGEGLALETAVEAYWTNLVRGKKSVALEFVHSDSRDDFLRRKEPALRSWDLVSIDRVSQSEAQVTVQVERGIGGQFYRWRLVEPWVKHRGAWKVRVVSGEQQLRMLYQEHKKAVALTGELTVRPDRLRIHFIGASQTDSVLVANGLKEPVSLAGIEVDRSKFRVEGAFETIQPGETGVVTVEFVGGESDKNLHDTLTFQLGTRERSMTHVVPIYYNYVSAGTRGLFGITKSEAGHFETRKQFIQHLRSHEAQVPQSNATNETN